MTTDASWIFVGAAPEGYPFRIEGLEVWKQAWTDTGERVEVEDPHYHRKFTFQVYVMGGCEKRVKFAAGEFSNGMFGFYTRG